MDNTMLTVDMFNKALEDMKQRKASLITRATHEVINYDNWFIYPIEDKTYDIER